ncbi:MAG: potassium-transporting ATPase subunit C [Bacillota bacterium]|nr:potassium-transporting ATPase subunit C [Bacillota bacterium]
MKDELWRGLRAALLIFLITGFLLPLTTTGLAELLFPPKAQGSLVFDDQGTLVGSLLIGQDFQGPQWFQGRPSASGNNPLESGSPQWGPLDPRRIEAAQKALASWVQANPGVPLPSELAALSASALDPHITREAALAQVPRIARLRGLSEAELVSLVDGLTEESFRFLGSPPRVNVLLLNRKLAQLANTP